MNKSWKISLGCGLFAFGVTLALLKIASLGDRTERLGKGAVRESQGDILAPSERARSHREFVMNILQTRRSQPLRAPEEWMQFVASLDAWYRAAQSDCIATLTSNSFNAILRLVEEPRENMTTEELFSIARETSESKTRFACWEEVWKRTSEQGPERSAELLASMPAIYRPVFRDRLLKSWVKAKGIQSLEQIAASQFTSALDFDYAFRLCAEVDPEQCVKYLEKADYHKLQERFGSSLRTREG